MSTKLSPPTLILSFKESISLVEQPDGRLLLRSPMVDIPLDRASTGLIAALQLLSRQGGTEEELVDLVEQYDGVLALSTLFYYLERFNQLGLLCHTLAWQGNDLATIVPLSPAYQFRPIQPVVDKPYSLSRFAYLRQTRRQLVLESPLGYAQIVLHHWQTAVLLHLLAHPHTLDDLYQTVRDISKETISLFLSLLLGAKTLSEGEDEASDPVLVQWTFHDLLFHSRSRLGRHANPYGEHRRFLGEIASLPALKPPMSTETIPLYRPDIETLKTADLPLTRVLEERRSLRQHGQPAITLEQVGEFLYRVARLRALNTAAEAPYESTNRPYPSGGASYELELYLAANACQGLPFGLYHYDPHGHQLYRLAGQNQHIEKLLADAALSAGQTEPPQLLIILAARFQRVAWKYDSLAYALILKHVGVLYQSMYLVATAMNLAPCALGGGNADLFALAAGLDYYAETSVGEFILGSRRTEV